MRRSWGIMVLALGLTGVLVGMVGGCAATAPPGPGQSFSAPTSSAAAIRATPSSSVTPSAASSTGASASPSIAASQSPLNTHLGPSSAPTLAPGGRLAIRYSGTSGTQFNGVATGLFDDGAVVPVDASGVLSQQPFTQTLGEATVALRVTGTIVSGSGTYRVEILGGHLDESGIFVEDQVLALDEATGRGEEVRVDYGNVDL